MKRPFGFFQQLLLVNNHTFATKTATATTERKKVIVVGAGFSGLSAAYHLHNLDVFDVEILEARGRLGGRVHSFDLDGTMIDLGGQWVHEASTRNPIRKLMKELDLSFVKQPTRLATNNIVFDRNGELINRSTVKSASKAFYKALDNYKTTDINVHSSLGDVLDAATNDSSSWFDIDSVQQAMNYVVHRTECHEGARLDEISVFLDDVYENLGGPDEIPKGTYHKVVKAIADKIGIDTIQLNSSVSCIAYNNNNIDDSSSEHGGSVEVTLSSGESVIGDYCICTVPLGVLQKRKIQFKPPLSGARWKSIDSIGMGSLGKVALKFEYRFWQPGYFGSSDVDPKFCRNFYDCTPDVGAPVLFCFLGGDAAHRVDSEHGISDEEAVQETMECLKSIYGNDIPDPMASAVTRWNLDPFACGAYSFTKVGCTEDAYDEIASPIGNLLFAGEHTSKERHSCVHGAWETGQREAARLVRMIKSR